MAQNGFNPSHIFWSFTYLSVQRGGPSLARTVSPLLARDKSRDSGLQNDQQTIWAWLAFENAMVQITQLTYLKNGEGTH